MRIGFGRLLGGQRIPPELVGQIKAIPRSKIEWMADAVAALAILLQAVVVAMLYGALPDTIPTHFGANGLPDDWNGKGMLLFLLGLNILMYALLALSDRFPALMNFPVAITAQNVRRQFLLMRYMMQGLKVLICWLFSYISYGTMAVALGWSQGLGWVIWLFFAALLGLVAAAFVLSYKWR